ncbi:MAG: M14 family zinc carboxypeptidase [Aquabacterium sp.]|uniref:M14 family zinc carboxypeptidase n=1 Tax=Aquabacterium sp. TaxID=1872578 RepID=UPI003BC698B3
MKRTVVRRLAGAVLACAAASVQAHKPDVIPAHAAGRPLSASSFCEVMTRRLPNVSRAVCARAQLQAMPVRSVSGNQLVQRDVVSPHARLRVLVVGGIHGDELSSTALVLHWIGAAMETPSNIHWRFVPLMNPDGMLQSRPSRTNARGVDLNRNFPTPNWDKEAPMYWKERTRSDPRRFPGGKPLSEPESKWLHDEMERWKPDLIVSVHAPYGVLDFDGPTVPPKRLGRLYLDQVGIFPGSLGNYGGVYKKVPVVTIELPNALRTPQDAEIRQMWLDLLRWTADRLGAD